MEKIMSWDIVEKILQYFVSVLLGSAICGVVLLLYMFFNYVFFGVTYP